MFLQVVAPVCRDLSVQIPPNSTSGVSSDDGASGPDPSGGIEIGTTNNDQTYNDYQFGGGTHNVCDPLDGSSKGSGSGGGDDPDGEGDGSASGGPSVHVGPATGSNTLTSSNAGSSARSKPWRQHR